MLKNYMKEGQKLPLFGVGPCIVCEMALVNVIGIVLFGYMFQIGILERPGILIFRIVGGLLIVLGIAIWFIGAVKSDMDESITENKLQTKGIYAWVSNPMYSGWWIALSGITLMWHGRAAGESGFLRFTRCAAVWHMLSGYKLLCFPCFFHKYNDLMCYKRHD